MLIEKDGIWYEPHGGELEVWFDKIDGSWGSVSFFNDENYYAGISGHFAHINKRNIGITFYARDLYEPLKLLYNNPSKAEQLRVISAEFSRCFGRFAEKSIDLLVEFIVRSNQHRYELGKQAGRIELQGELKNLLNIYDA
jgi:hypothetical protein